MTTKPPPISSDTKTICAVCAWRADCQKKYSAQHGGTFKCADYTRDMTLPPDEDDKQP